MLLCRLNYEGMRTTGREETILIFRKELALVSRLPQCARKASPSQARSAQQPKYPGLEEVRADHKRKACARWEWNKTKQRGESEPKDLNTVRRQHFHAKPSAGANTHHQKKNDSSENGALVLCPQGSRVLWTPPLAFPLRLTMLPAMKNLQPWKSVEILGLWPPC